MSSLFLTKDKSSKIFSLFSRNTKDNTDHSNLTTDMDTDGEGTKAAETSATDGKMADNSDIITDIHALTNGQKVLTQFDYQEMTNKDDMISLL